MKQQRSALPSPKSMDDAELGLHDDSVDQLLAQKSASGSGAAEQGGSKSSVWFKAYVVVSMTFIWTSYTLMIRYTRSTTPPELMYSSTTVVLLNECTKFVISLVMFWREHHYSISSTKHTFTREYLGKPVELAKMSVPSLAYALQNNLDFVALANLHAGVYQVTTQLKVVTTALFMVVMLGRRYSRTRWLAIFGLFVGVAFVQLDTVSRAPDVSAQSASSENYFVGLAAVLTTCVTAGFAGVYFEKMLKDGGSTPFWVRNLQMYSCGIVSAATSALVTDADRIAQQGFFHGYNANVLAIVALLSVGGIYISLVMKHLDNLHKSFASAVSIIFVFVGSVLLFGSTLGFYFFIGALVVCGSIVLYNSVPE